MERRDAGVPLDLLDSLDQQDLLAKMVLLDFLDPLVPRGSLDLVEKSVLGASVVSLVTMEYLDSLDRKERWEEKVLRVVLERLVDQVLMELRENKERQDQWEQLVSLETRDQPVCREKTD